MKRFFSKLKETLLDALFPKSCIICSREGEFLCQDCLALIDISERQYCPFCFPPKIVLDGKTCSDCRKEKNLNGLFSAASYQNFVVKKAIQKLKNEPYIKELSIPLASLILAHLNLLEQNHLLKDLRTKKENFVFVPVPLHKSKLKRRGFNPALEIAADLSMHLEISMISDCLAKTEETLAQTEIKREEREENVKGVFFCQNPEKIRDKIILLVDDFFSSGSTMEECAKVLKGSNAKEVWGMVVAREKELSSFD